MFERGKTAKDNDAAFESFRQSIGGAAAYAPVIASSGMAIRPLTTANLVKPAMLWMSSLRMRRSRWVSTVRVPMFRRQAISLLQRPSAMQVRTSLLAIREVGRVGSLLFAANKLVQGHAGDVRTEERLAGIDRLYGLHEFVRGRLLEDVAVGARLGAPQHELGVDVRGQHQHFDLRQFLPQGFGDGQAGHVRHVNVGQEDVRHQFPGFAQRFLAVSGFAHHFQVRVPFQAGNDAPAHDGVVIRQEHPDSSAGAGAKASAGSAMVRAGVDAVGRTREREE